MKVSRFYKICRLLPLVIINAVLPAQSSTYTSIFTSVSASEWTTEGNVSTTTIDSTLAFVFSFDESNPPKAKPDTVVLDLTPSIDMSSCDSVFIYFDTKGLLPNSESWVIPKIRTYIKHETNPYWTEIYTKDLSHLGGWTRELNLRFKVAVRTDQTFPGEFQMYNIKIHGSCTP